MKPVPRSPIAGSEEDGEPDGTSIPIPDFTRLRVTGEWKLKDIFELIDIVAAMRRHSQRP